jgi:uncharacterized membrane protein
MGIRTGILWMCAATCLFVWQDSTARILVQTYPVTEIAFVRYFIHIALVGLFLASRDPRLLISRRPALQIVRSGFLLGATLFVMLALRLLPLTDVTAIVWVAPVLVTALSGILLREQVTPAAWVSVITGLIGVWVIIGLRGIDLSLTMLFPLLAALSNALYQVTTRLFLHGACGQFVLRRISALRGHNAFARRLRHDAFPGICGGCEPFLSHSGLCGCARQYHRPLWLYVARLGSAVQPRNFRGGSARARNLRRYLDCRGRPVRRPARKKAAGLGAA